MKLLVMGLALLAGASGRMVQAQTAQEMQSAAPAKVAGETEEQHGRRLLDEMVKALGGDAWLNKRTMYREGQTAAFFQGQPTGSVIRFVEYKRFPADGPELSRVEFLSLRGMIEPGMKRDVVHLWTADQGYELTYKGRTTLPEKQVTEYLRRRAHSIEEVMRTWVKAPGVIVVYTGTDMRDRRPVDKVSILASNNDAVTIEIEQGSHFPLQRSYEWRNEQFKDHDLDEEVYGDWRIFDGVATPMNMTTYHNGDMAAQMFYMKVKFGQTLSDELFNKDALLKKK